MARELIPSDATLKAIRTGDTRRRLSDGDGLYLLLFVNGGSHGWRFDYTYQTRRKLISLGTYPDTSLALARRKADAARALVAEGRDPSAERKAERQGFLKARTEEARRTQGLPASDSFEAVAREWFAVRLSGYRATACDHRSSASLQRSFCRSVALASSSAIIRAGASAIRGATRSDEARRRSAAMARDRVAPASAQGRSSAA